MKKKDCTTCGRRLVTQQFPKALHGSKCTHERETCRRCWRQWLQAQVEHKHWDQISCCQCANLLTQSEIKALATDATFQRYVDAEVKATLSADPDFVWCAAKGCPSGQLHAEGEIFTCAACGVKTCVPCRAPWHGGETCAGFRERRREEEVQARVREKKEADRRKAVEEAERMRVRRAEDEAASEARVKATSKTCPQCRSRIEKIG